MKFLNRLLLSALFLIISSPFASALSMKTANLEELAQLSERIFRGKVIDVQAEDDSEESGRFVHYYTFKVDDCLKGSCGETITFKQLNWLAPPYKEGETYVIFLSAPSPKTGLTAPIGLSQGKFDMKYVNGNWIVEEKPALQATQNHTSPHLSASVSSGPETYNQFRSTVLNLVEATR